MKKKYSKYDSLLFYLSVAAMIILIYSVFFLSYGSLPQNSLLLVGAFILFISATAGKQHVIQALEIIVLVGIALSFLRMNVLYSLTVVLFVALLIVVYLLHIEHYKKEPIGVVGSAGFVLMGIGFAFNVGNYPLVTGLALASGALLAAVYAATAFWLYRVRLQVIIAVLNVIFAVSPILLILRVVGI